MEDLFRSYWWLLFPVGYFIYAGFQSWLGYRANRDTLDLIKRYADQGKDPPPELLAKLNKQEDIEAAIWGASTSTSDRPRSGRRRREGHWYSVVLFGVMAAGFGYAAWSNLYEAGEAFIIVTFVMSALCLASLVSALMRAGRD